MASDEYVNILLVEDNPGDAMLVRESMRDIKLHNRLHHVSDGDEAMRFLRRTGEYTDAARPDLILLDLNLPGMSGREVLSAIKGDANLEVIPIVVMTSSSAERDIVESYEIGANCYVTKPLDLDQFMHVVQSVETFWLSIVKLP
ncbi:Response regulator receiver domain-containing protein [Sphingomonas sp. YR710]|jgi:CheY-like chemotaxis protein|uniref:response regulator n=1 Tax=Sphingomonas sp. YR710 TaxID=1882773 RepID=UPI00088C0F12|nr:response regulator [Sphingomonas sp. YR710]SDC29328.1 Response regulator receiver domain-containing protein [Sphingomonas sp. YR710]